MATAIEVTVPDIGGFKDVSVIDVLVRDGEQVSKETPLITIETEKAAMDVPAPAAGRITQVKLKQGDKVSEGSLILLLEPDAAGATAVPSPAATPANAAVQAPPPAASVAEETPAPAPTTEGPAAAARPPVGAIEEQAFSEAYASPSVRKFAREIGADLGKITGTGPKMRITQEDVKSYVKRILATAPIAGAAGEGSAATPPAARVSAAQGSGLPKVPQVDFAAFGPVEIKPLSRIQRISGARLQASWINLPHVTQHDDADVTDLEIARGFLKDRAARDDVKLTPLAFIIRACILSLQKFPRFNSSLDDSGESLVLKRYFNIGFAADTPNGLMVPVIRDADRLDVYAIAASLGALSSRARAGKLSGADMQGGTFTVSSLGGIGGSAFTPIINAPEVAILGVSRSTHKPVYENGAFVPRLMMPLSLSYDHRVIDGAEAARFIVSLSHTLSDVKALL